MPSKEGYSFDAKIRRLACVDASSACLESSWSVPCKCEQRAVFVRENFFLYPIEKGEVASKCRESSGDLGGDAREQNCQSPLPMSRPPRRGAAAPRPEKKKTRGVKKTRACRSRSEISLRLDGFSHLLRRRGERGIRHVQLHREPLTVLSTSASKARPQSSFARFRLGAASLRLHAHRRQGRVSVSSLR